MTLIDILVSAAVCGREIEVTRLLPSHRDQLACVRFETRLYYGVDHFQFLQLSRRRTSPTSASLCPPLESRGNVECIFRAESEFQRNQMAHTAFRHKSAAKWLSNDRTAQHAVDGELQ
jgi:hypothetical protein